VTFTESQNSAENNNDSEAYVDEEDEAPVLEADIEF